MTAISHSKASADQVDILLVDGEDQCHDGVEIISLTSRLNNHNESGDEDEPAVDVNERPNFQG